MSKPRSARLDPPGRFEPRHGAGIVAALERSLPYALFAVLPTAVVVGMFVVAVDTGPLAWDSRNELYPRRIYFRAQTVMPRVLVAARDDRRDAVRRAPERGGGMAFDRL